MKRIKNEVFVVDNEHYHDTWKLLKNYRDVVWSLELSVHRVKRQFTVEYGSSIEEFLDTVYLAGADLSGSEIEQQAKCIEHNYQMLALIDNAVDLIDLCDSHNMHTMPTCFCSNRGGSSGAGRGSWQRIGDK